MGTFEYCIGKYYEIEDANFCFKSKNIKKLIHDNNYDKGYILNFKKSKKG